MASLSVRRSGRNRTINPRYNQQNTPQLVRRKNKSYALNPGKALAKKKDATGREPMKFEHNAAASQFKFTFSTGVFEVFKTAIIDHYTPAARRKEVEMVENETENGAIQDVSIFTGKFTVNIYNTTSRVTVNGSHYKKFQKVFNDIYEKIDQDASTKLNAKIRQQIEQATAGTSPETRRQIEQPTTGTSRMDKQATESEASDQSVVSQDSSQEEPLDRSVEDPCPVCSESVLENQDSLQCSACHSWTHKSCDKSITDDIYKEHSKSENLNLIYHCPICQIMTDQANTSPVRNTPPNNLLALKPAPRTGPTAEPTATAVAPPAPAPPPASKPGRGRPRKTPAVEKPTPPLMTIQQPTHVHLPPISQSNPIAEAQPQQPSSIAQSPHLPLTSSTIAMPQLTFTQPPPPPVQPPTTPLDPNLLSTQDALNRREKLLKQQEKDMAHRDKLLKQKETELRHSVEQTASQAAYIRTLEEKSRTQESVIESLQIRMATQQSQPAAQPQGQQPVQPQPNLPQHHQLPQYQLPQQYHNPLQDMQIRFLEDRIRALELQRQSPNLPPAQTPTNQDLHIKLLEGRIQTLEILLQQKTQNVQPPLPQMPISHPLQPFQHAQPTPWQYQRPLLPDPPGIHQYYNPSIPGMPNIGTHPLVQPQVFRPTQNNRKHHGKTWQKRPPPPTARLIDLSPTPTKQPCDRAASHIVNLMDMELQTPSAPTPAAKGPENSSSSPKATDVLQMTMTSDRHQQSIPNNPDFLAGVSLHMRDT